MERYGTVGFVRVVVSEDLKSKHRANPTGEI